MALSLRRLDIAAGDQVVLAYAEGARAVYLIHGEHPQLIYGNPAPLSPGEVRTVTADTAIGIGVFEEQGDGVR